MNSALAALIAVAVYIVFGALAVFVFDGLTLWILSGFCMWLTLRMAHAIADGLE